MGLAFSSRHFKDETQFEILGRTSGALSKMI